MAKQSSVNLDITNNADGFSISGGTIGRTFGISGGDVTLVGSGAATVTFPTTSTTVAGLGITQTFTALQNFNAGITVNTISTTTSTNTGLAYFNAGLCATSGVTIDNGTVLISNYVNAVYPLTIEHGSGPWGLHIAGVPGAGSGSIRFGSSTTATANAFVTLSNSVLRFENGISVTGGDMLLVGPTTVTLSNVSDHAGLAFFSAGISATSGSTFNNATVYIVNSGAVDPLYVQHASTNALKVSTTGQARSGAIRLGNAATSTQNTFVSQTDGVLTFYNGFSTTGSNMLQLSSSGLTVSQILGSGVTFISLLKANAGGSFSSISVANGFTVAAPILTLQSITPIIRTQAGGSLTLSTPRPAGGIYPAGATFYMLGWDYDQPGSAVAELLVGDLTNGYGRVNINTFNSTSGLVGITGTVILTGGITASQAITGGTFMSAAGGYRVTSGAIKTLTGTTYTMLVGDDGKILTTSNASLQIFEIPTGLPVGFNCSVLQLGTGPVGFSAASGVTLNTFAGKTLMAGQYAAVSIIEYATNILSISGGLTT